MEDLVKELLKNHEKDRNLSSTQVQQEGKRLREKYSRIDNELKENEQLVGLDWSDAILKDFNFENTKLSSKEKPAHFERTQLQNSHFEKADLPYAHFECSNLTSAHMNGSNLQYALLNMATLKETYLEGCNLIEADYGDADYFEFAKFHKIDESDPTSALREYYNLEKYFKDRHRPERAATLYFYRRRLMTKRHLIDWKENKRDIKAVFAFLINRIWEALCGYAERPWRVIRTMISVILLFALFYYSLGGPANKNEISSSSILDSVYFSGVTFTTLGYGDLHPVVTNFGMKFLVVGEALIGAFLMALFLVVLSRKMIR